MSLLTVRILKAPSHILVHLLGHDGELADVVAELVSQDLGPVRDDGPLASADGSSRVGLVEHERVCNKGNGVEDDYFDLLTAWCHFVCRATEPPGLHDNTILARFKAHQIINMSESSVNKTAPQVQLKVRHIR